jgi:N-acetylmuramoyl-L-alanine amidase
MGKAYPDHASARLNPSPNHNERRITDGPDLLILHYTAMEDGHRAVQWLRNPESEVSAHYMVHRDGAVEQLVPEGRRAWHAGVSSWRSGNAGPAEAPHDLNSRSIGVEICNTGVCFGDGDAPFMAYPDVQIEALIDLCQGIVTRHGIAKRHVLGHSDIAPSRKQDPGEHFPWHLLHDAGIGHWVDPEPIGSGKFFAPGDAGAPIEAMQQMLSLYGYDVSVTGHYDAHTCHVVTAFQRHFRPEKVDGVADMSTLTTLHKVLGALSLLK